MLKILINLIQVQIKEFIRKPIVLFWALGFPILMSIVLGFAFSNKPKTKITLAIFCSKDDTHTCSSSQIATDIQIIEQFLKKQDDLFQEIQSVEFQFDFMTQKSAFNMLQKNMVHAILEYQSTTHLYTYHFDPKNDESNKSYIILKHFFDIKNTILLLQKDPTNKQSILKHATKKISSVGFRFIDFLIPGLLAMSIMHSALWGIAWPFIELRSKNLLKRMLASPISKTMLMFSYFCTRIIIATIECLTLLTFGKLIFGIQMQGSLISFLILFVSAFFCFAGIAILLGSRTDVPRVGSGLIELIAVPMSLLSGIFFHYSNFPDSWIPIIKYLPLTIIADTMRAIFLAGISLTEVILPSSILLTIGIVCSLIGIKIFKWT